MKQLLYVLTLNVIFIINTHAEPRTGQICHADSEYVRYNYPGLWEKDNHGNLICNYWQFLSEAEVAESLRDYDDVTNIEMSWSEIEEHNNYQDEDIEVEIETEADDLENSFETIDENKNL
ncbi:hypothetical protein RYD26_05335 [Pasteurellaceae bacterium LIM206]|nr:hypothetical protein [Pasteurellaceae bacterium LIM206]